MNDLVVSIVSYNAADALERCLRHVEASDFPGSIEVVVVDNGSTDGAPDVAKGFAGVRVLEPGSNLFYSGGNNLAWEATESRYFLILNSDCYVDPDALATAVAYLDEHPAVGAVTLRMAFESGEEQAICARFQDRWYSLLWYTALGGALPGLRARAKGRVFYEGWDRTSTRPVEVAPDSFLMVRRSAFPDGLYDEAMALYFTEDDLCKRLAAADWRLDYVAGARVVHPERTSTNREPPERIRAIFFKDLQAYYAKFEPAWYAGLLVGLIRLSEQVRRVRHGR
ncbi:MAG TPA: glycosyltransferase [Actinomycetota bacterium]|nr:glycosyltransferase [Actinomycetota bacterium]